MTRVDFYVVENAAREQHDRTLCRVIEKAFSRGHQIYVALDSEPAMQAFDDLLWRYQDTSFVPHGSVRDNTPVVLGMDAAQCKVADVLVNFCADVPVAASRFERVVETAGFDDDTRRAARARYRHYQERGFPLNTHKVKG